MTSPAMTLHNVAMASGYKLCIHPATKYDIHRDLDSDRLKLRTVELEKYPLLEDPPRISSRMHALLGPVEEKTNDWVDQKLLAAVEADAVDFLVTEDRGIHARAKRLGLENRVLMVAEAIAVIRRLEDQTGLPPPAVEAVKAHAIDPADPILNTFRADYQGFDTWFSRSRREQRQAWVIKSGTTNLAAFCLVKPETGTSDFLQGKVLKLCSIKVGEAYTGLRFGELLLKSVFAHAIENKYDWLYVTIFPKHDKLIQLLVDFGFQYLPQRTALGELVLAKRLAPDPHATESDPLAFHIAYGPYHFRSDVAWHLVPILPRYSRILFPESHEQSPLFPGVDAFGNAIRKAYLCNSPNRQLRAGSIVVFYRSRQDRGVIALGVVEQTLVSDSADEIARTVGKRTVYGLKEIRRLCRKPVLAILFRQSRVFKPEIPIGELVAHKLFVHPPQSIISVNGGSRRWLISRIAA